MRYASLFVVLILLCGCALSLQDGTLDYASLYQIAHKLVARDKQHNIEGLTEAVGASNAQKIISWYDASLLAIKAAKSIIEKSNSRSLIVSEIVAEYQKEREWRQRMR